MTDKNLETTSDHKARNPFRPGLGEYSNNPTEFERERIAAREQVERTVGEYTLTLDPKYPMWRAARKDGKPVPKGLQGAWKTVEAFRRRVDQLG